jgi:hypothetical protein
MASPRERHERDDFRGKMPAGAGISPGARGSEPGRAVTADGRAPRREEG